MKMEFMQKKKKLRHYKNTGKNMNKQSKIDPFASQNSISAS